ncbi:MAG TPA: Crp/Fnr family transcriptional regulator [Puia sp.]|nr:Crp/Fnr family transcriptional regulator [Puia sp.]
MEDIWEKIDRYILLSAESKAALESILKKKTYKKHDFFLTEGQVPRAVAFVAKGLFSQYHTSENGDVIIKRFFPEGYFLASMSAMLKKAPGMFTIQALEPSTILEYDFYKFKELTETHADIAAFYIKYMEVHWIIEKEPLEISFRYDSARSRYLDFLKNYPALEPRLKQHHIASYLGITPTQLSRIRSDPQHM